MNKSRGFLPVSAFSSPAASLAQSRPQAIGQICKISISKAGGRGVGASAALRVEQGGPWAPRGSGAAWAADRPRRPVVCWIRARTAPLWPAGNQPKGKAKSFYLMRKGRPVTNRDGSIRIFANALEMGRLRRGDQSMIWRAGERAADQGGGQAARPDRAPA